MTTGVESLRVLLVEDDESDILVVREHLHHATAGRFELTAVQTGRAALAALTSQQFDVCLVDLLMQPISGLALMPLLRSGGLDAPIIVMTGLDDHQHDVQAMQAGAAAFLCKADISAKHLERAIRYARALYAEQARVVALPQAVDGVTGLHSRAIFGMQLSQALLKAAEAQQPVHLAYISLKGFKRVNTHHGHEVGDAALRRVAQVLQNTASLGAIVGRIVGDEMAVASIGCSAEDFHQRLDALVDAFAAPVELNNFSIQLHLSIGTCEFPAMATDAPGLLRHAEQAMRIAKHENRRSPLRYQTGMHTQGQRREMLAEQLRLALLQNKLHLVFEPFIAFSNGALKGTEVLSRWTTSEGEIIPPSEFIPVAEEAQLIFPLTDWVLTTGLAAVRHWRDEGLFPDDARLHVNAPADYVGRDDLSLHLQTLLAHHALPGTVLALELTEGSLLMATRAQRQNLEDVRALGVQLFIDDFGTGFSSLSYLSELPVDGIKIDRSFLASLSDSEKSQSVVRVIIGLADALNLAVIAEGIETPQQQQLIASLGCATGQGYLFSKPAKAESFKAFLAQKN